MSILTLLILALIVLTIVGHVRNQIVRAIHSVFELLAVPVAVSATFTRDLLEPVGGAIRTTLDGLTYEGNRATPAEPRGERATPAEPVADGAPPPHPRGWSGWEIIGPLVYLVVLLALAAADLYFAVLGFPVLLHRPLELAKLPIDVELLPNFALIGLCVFLGFVALDLLGVTPIQRPWRNLTDDQRRIALGAVGVAFLLAITMAIAFWSRREQLIKGVPPPPEYDWLPLLLWICLATLLVISTALASWSLPASLASLYCLLLMAAFGVLYLVSALLRAVILIFDPLAGVFTALIDVPAGLGIAFWNWLCRLPMTSGLRIQGIVPETRPAIRVGVEPRAAQLA